ncbi:MAG: hypothetical protein E7173_03020 [Firmicutes bacterium]|nr:hypothetical protein [Bacillota bacterium]
MDLLNMLNNCSLDELNSIVDDAIKKATEHSEERRVLGFAENLTAISKIATYKGFIHPDSRIKYSNWSANTYSMKTTDYIYEFARHIKKMNINNIGYLVKSVEDYINIYFGIVSDGKDMRDAYFDQIAWSTTKTDDEYFEKIASFEIGDLKGKNVAMCTERAALAQNLLSLFGIDVYYCMGCIENNGKVEPHCFNIARAKDKFLLLDYSLPVSVFSNGIAVDFAPFQGGIRLDEIEGVLLNGVNKSFDDYEYVKNSQGIKKVSTGQVRLYKVGSMTLQQAELQNIVASLPPQK